MSHAVGDCKTAVVTEAPSGIGSQVCHFLHDHSWSWGTRHHKDFPRKLVDGCPGRIISNCVNLYDIEHCRTLTAETTASFARTTAGTHAAGPHVSMIHVSRDSPADSANQVNVDVNEFFNIVHAAFRSLREEGGATVAVTTAGAMRYPVRDDLSTVPKKSVEALMYGFAAEEGQYDIRVNSIGPRMFTDGMAERLISAGDLYDRALNTARSNIGLRRFSQAHNLAEAEVAAFLVSNRASYISGQKLDVDESFGV